MIDNKPVNNSGYSFILVVIDNVYKFVRSVFLKRNFSQTKTDGLSKKLKKSRLKPNLIETDDENEYVNKSFNSFLEQKNFNEIFTVYFTRSSIC